MTNQSTTSPNPDGDKPTENQTESIPKMEAKPADSQATSIPQKAGQPDIGKDNWLHVLSDSIAHYVKDGGVVILQETADGLLFKLLDVHRQDSRLSDRFHKLG